MAAVDDLVRQIPTTGYGDLQPGAPQVSNDSPFVRNVKNTLAALPGVAPLMAGGMALRGASAVGNAASKLASMAAPVAPYAPVVAGGIALSSASAPPPAPAQPAPASVPAVDQVASPPAVAAVAAPAQIAAPNAQATSVTAPQQQPAGGGSIVKTILNPDGTPGKRLAWGAGATPLSDLGSASYPVQQSNGTIISGLTQDAAQSSAAARLSSGLVDPQAAIATGLQQQLAHQQAVIEAAADAASKYSGGRKKMFTDIFHAALSAGGQNNFGGVQEQGAAAQMQNNVAAGHLNLEAQTKAPVINAQTAYTSAKTPQAKASAEEQLRVLQGKYEKETPELFATTALPGSTDALGNKTPGGAIVTNKRDGTTKIIYGSELQPKAEPLPPKDKLVKGTTYDTPRGKAKWDGSQFLPV